MRPTKHLTTDDFEVGDAVVYVGPTDLTREDGVVMAKNDRYVFVRYAGDSAGSKATSPTLLEKR